jgi:L-cysteate sulfo-lyase
MKFSSFPRARLAALPTPLQYLPNLTKKLGGPKIWVKRDDLTGLAFGGNKARKLEYIMGDALEKGADVIVTGAGFQSNWCTQTVAAAKKAGLDIYLVKSAPSEDFDTDDWDGNHLLHHLMGAHVKTVHPDKFMETIEATMEKLKAEGRKPYYTPVGGSDALGAGGYFNAVLELTYQANNEGVHFDYLVHATGSGGTQAGLIMGAKAFNTGMKIVGAACGYGDVSAMKDKVRGIVEESKKRYDLDFTLNDEDLIIHTQYAGDGYGIMSEAKLEAVKLLAETEGIMIDPVYTSVAMACIIDQVKQGNFKETDNVVFLHTGGAVALFPYKEPLRAHLEGKPLPWKVPEWSPQSE